MKTYLSFVAALLGGLIGVAGTGYAQSAEQELRTAIIEMRDGQVAVLEELQAIRKLLEQGARPQAAAPGAGDPTELTLRGIDGDPVKGDAGAALVLVEYTDYQCPYCGRHFANTWPSLASDYVDSGKLRYVLRDFPLDVIHPQASKAAEAARCAGDQDRYWEMHDALFQNQKALGEAELKEYAEGLGLDMADFAACLEDGRHADAVRADLDEGKGAGVTGTPTFFLAVEGEDGALEARRKIVGAQAYAAFKQAIDEALEEQAEAPGEG